MCRCAKSYPGYSALGFDVGRCKSRLCASWFEMVLLMLVYQRATLERYPWLSTLENKRTHYLSLYTLLYLILSLPLYLSLPYYLYISLSLPNSLSLSSFPGSDPRPDSPLAGQES